MTSRILTEDQLAEISELNREYETLGEQIQGILNRPSPSLTDGDKEGIRLYTQQRADLHRRRMAIINGPSKD